MLLQRPLNGYRVLRHLSRRQCLMLSGRPQLALLLLLSLNRLRSPRRGRGAMVAVAVGRLSLARWAFGGPWSSALPPAGSERTTRYCFYVFGLAREYPRSDVPAAAYGGLQWCVVLGGGDGGEWEGCALLLLGLLWPQFWTPIGCGPVRFSALCWGVEGEFCPSMGCARRLMCSPALAWCMIGRAVAFDLGANVVTRWE